ncbi:SPOR domain-containing protein [bacterium]|nr:SPOR domain-containing protein [bacterium]
MRSHRLLNGASACLGLFFFLSGCESGDDTDRLATTSLNSQPIPITNEVSATAQPFRIQVSAFTNLADANSLAYELRNSNWDSHVVADSISFTKPIYRVRLGPFATEETAFARLTSIRKQGFTDAYIIKIETVPATEFTSTGSDITEQREANDTPIRKQLTLAGGCSNPKWSPNGREIAFYRDTGDLQGIYTVGTGGGHVSRIIESTVSRRITPEFAWAPSGDKLAVRAEEATDNWEPAEAVWLVTKRGTEAKKALQISHEWRRIIDLSWSQDGAYIAAGIQDTELPSSSNSAVEIRIEKLPSLIDVDIGGSGGENSIIIGSQSYPGNRLIAGGWQDRNRYLFFSIGSDINETNGTAVYKYELWSYDLSVRESALIGTMQKGKLVERPLLTPSGDRGVLFGPSGIVVVDLTSGREIPFFDEEFENIPIQAMAISHSNHLYFLANHELWSCNFDDEKKQVGIKIDSRTLTVSPFSPKLCFAESGNLFTVRMPRK